ncbi:MAG: transglycosylase SLT domain-containing protein [Gemmatimonadota bacterium]
MTEPDVTGKRRDAGDRRERSDGNDRRGAKKTSSSLAFILRSIGAVVVLLLVIVYAFVNTRPIYSTSGTLGEELRKHAPEVAAVLSPRDSAHSENVDRLMATPQFQEEKRNFYEDVMRLKQVDSARADSIAEFAVREAYVRGISPAIVFGVMLTENSRFISKATSNVGAVGLMQVYPKVWLTEKMTALFGKDLATDSTNVKYGVFILSQYFRPKVKGGGTKEVNWKTALLRYNGCVRGTNTPRCHTYPNKVQKFVEGSAKSICNGRGFYECMAKPFIAGLFGQTNGTSAGDVVQKPAAPPTSPTPAPPATVTAPLSPMRAPAATVVKKPLKKSARKPARKSPAKRPLIRLTPTRP